MLKLILSLVLNRKIAIYAVFTFGLFLLQSPVITLSESVFKKEIISPVSKSAKTLVKIITPTSTPTPTPTLTPTPVPSQTPTPMPSPTATPAPQAIGGFGEEIWDKIALCESGGNWSINTGNGYFGGLQFSQGAWDSTGGTGNPSEASREEQITRGKILQEKRGWGVWGLCAQKLGLN